MRDHVVRLFGEDDYEQWAGSLARLALSTVTADHVRAAEMQAVSEVLANRLRLPLVADV